MLTSDKASNAEVIRINGRSYDLVQFSDNCDRHQDGRHADGLIRMLIRRGYERSSPAAPWAPHVFREHRIGGGPRRVEWLQMKITIPGVVCPDPSCKGKGLENRCVAYPHRDHYGLFTGMRIMFGAGCSECEFTVRAAEFTIDEWSRDNAETLIDHSIDEFRRIRQC